MRQHNTSSARLQITDEEIEAAAQQFVRKVSGYRKPSRANEEAFNRAISEITATTQILLDNLVAR